MAEAYTVKALSPLRKIIAARMSEAARTIPHFRVATDIQMDALLALREKVNSTCAETRISVNDCIIKGCASALMKHPAINAQFVGEEIHHYHQADISVVIAVEGGVSTPVVRGADRKSIGEISAEVKQLAARAMAGQLKMSEIMGGSFSISNLGGRGVVQFDAIINAPQCAVLAVGGTRRQVVVKDDGEFGIATLLRATLSVDHRAIDGAVGAEFLATLREVLERPQELFEQ